MEKRLTADLNVVANSNLEIQLLDGDLNIIQKLDDEPNDVGGLTSAELKAKFDESGNIIKKYINETLIPAVLTDDATEESRKQAEAARVAAEQGRVTAEEGRVSAEAARAVAEQARSKAEASRVSAENAREAAETTRADETAGIVARATEQANAAADSASQAAGSEQIAKDAADTATGAASSASQSAAAASGSASQAQASAAAAAQSAASVDGINKTAQSWAVGGTGTRPGEDTDNAKYWAKRAEGIVSGDVFYVDLEGGPNASTGKFEYTTTMTQDQLTKAYTSGKSLVCRLVANQIPITLPLFMVGDQTNIWVFSGSGAINIDENTRFDAQTFTVALGNIGHRLAVVAQNTIFATQEKLAEHINNKVVHVTESDKARWNGKAEKPTMTTVTLSSAGWNSSTKQQAAAVSGVLADGTKQRVICSPVDESYDSVWNSCYVQCVGHGANSLTFQCDEIPTAAIEVYVSIQPVSFAS